MNSIILSVANTGGKWTRKDSPWVPMTPKEIIQDIVDSFNEGASMAHIHARDDNGQPTHESEAFARIIEGVRVQCKDIIIQISTGYLEGKVEPKLVPLLKLKPDMASFNLKGSSEEILLTARLMDEFNVKPAVECFSTDMLNHSKRLLENNILRAPVFYEFVYDLEESGISFQESAKDLISRYDHLPLGSIWSQTRGASHQRGLQALSVLLGGHIRTGLEDNLYIRQGVKAKKSAELIAEAVKIVEFLERKVASPKESREILGLSK